MRFALLALLPFVALACQQPVVEEGGASKTDLSDAKDDDAPKKSSKKSTTTKVTTPEVDLPAAPPAGPDVAYVGTLAETEPVGFGGATADGQYYCAVQQWKDVTINVVTNDKGHVKSLTFNATNAEEANPDCKGVTASPANPHAYSFTNDAPADAPAKLIAAATNEPQADLIADVAVHDDAGRVTIDFRAPAWRSTVQFKLTRSLPTD